MIPLNIEAPETGQLRQLADDLYWARFALPFRLNHINIYMLDTDEGWLLIDSGVNDQVTAKHWEMLLSGPLFGQPVCQILITHHHVDHMGYSGPLASITGAEICTSAAEAEHGHWLYDLSPDDFGQLLSQTYARYDLPAETVELVRHKGSRYRLYTAPLPAFERISAGQEFRTKYGLWTARIDTGHCDAQISLIDRTRNLFISVDFLLPRITPNISADIRHPDVDLLASYFAYLEEMKNLPPDMSIFPGHDWPFCSGGARATALIIHHHKRLDQLEHAALQAPLSVRSAMDVLFGRPFGDHELYFACGEARAHLNHLVATGRLSQKVDEGYDHYEAVA